MYYPCIIHKLSINYIIHILSIYHPYIIHRLLIDYPHIHHGYTVPMIANKANPQYEARSVLPQDLCNGRIAAQGVLKGSEGNITGHPLNNR